MLYSSEAPLSIKDNKTQNRYALSQMMLKKLFINQKVEPYISSVDVPVHMKLNNDS